MNDTLTQGPSPSMPTGKSQRFTAGRKQLLLLFGLVILSLIFWDTIFIYPVKVFVVFLHEISHGVAAVLTGGSVVELRVFEDQGGLALTRGGIPLIITSSGYIGSMLFGGALLLLAMNQKGVKFLALAVAALMLFITLLFVRNNFGFIFGLVVAAIMGFAGLKFPPRITQTLLQWLGALSCLYALLDIKDDLLTFEHRQTDAQILADMTGIPAIVWGVVWGAIALIVFYVIMKRAWKRASVTQ